MVPGTFLAVCAGTRATAYHDQSSTTTVCVLSISDSVSIRHETPDEADTRAATGPIGHTGEPCRFCDWKAAGTFLETSARQRHILPVKNAFQYDKMDEVRQQLLMLRWLARDPWLTSAQLGAVIGCNTASAATYLGELKAKGWVQCLAPREPELPRALVYALKDDGLRELARVKGRSVAEMAGRYQVSRAKLIRSLNDLPHHWRVREHLLCKLAARYGGMQVEWCWPRHFGQVLVFKDFSDRSGRLRPDCYGMVSENGHCYPFFVLWDDGLTPMLLERRRVRPFEKALQLYLWGFSFFTFPLLAIVAASPVRAQQYRERLRSNYQSALRVFVTDQVTLRRRHPLAAIWWRGTHDKTFGQKDEDACVWMLKEACGIPAAEYRFPLGWDDPTWIETADLSGALPPAQKVIGSPLDRLSTRAVGVPRQKNGKHVLGQQTCLGLSRHLSPAEKQALRLLGPLRVLTPGQLRRYVDTTPERCRRWLTHLTQLGLIIEVEPPMRAFLIRSQKLYVLSPDGLEWVARKSHHGWKRFRQFYGVALSEDGRHLVT